MPDIDMALVERINTAIRSVNIRFGPNALAIMAADGTVPLSQGESWHMALAVADELGSDLGTQAAPEEGPLGSAVADCDGQCCQQAEPTCGVMNPRKAATCIEAERHPDDTHRDAFGNTWPKHADDKPLFPKET